MIGLDKTSYSLYSRVNISVNASNQNVDPFKRDQFYVDIKTESESLSDYRLVETGLDTSRFTGYISLTGPDGMTIGEGPSDGRLKASRGDMLSVSFTSGSGQKLDAKATIDYHIGRIFFEKNSYRDDDTVLAILIDEDLNLDPEQRDIVHEFFLTSTFMRGIFPGIVPELGVNSGIFAAGGKATSSSGLLRPLQFNPDGEAIVAFYHDTTLPKPYSFVGNSINQTEGTWLFAVAPFLGTVPTIKPAPLFYGNYTEGQLLNNFIMKTESAVQDLKFLKYERKLEFVNVANKAGTLELQIPREAFHDIASASINRTNIDFTSNKNATHFNVKINYPEGNSKIEIFDLDTESPIVFRDPALVDQEDNALTDLTVGSQVVIQSQITNSQTNTQPFAYIVQIKDENDVTVSLSWLTGELAAADSFRPAQSWLPEESGEYRIQTFLWNNLETPSPLAPSKNIEVQVIA
ncbi:MAG: hypothetical protein HMLIMOIP_000053 [Candidatus Nitrosomirales archaeon]|jgi:hypothetical protein